jgi:hypothetical protein
VTDGGSEAPLIPRELIEAAISAEALADGAAVARNARLEPAALRQLLADIGAGRPGALEMVVTVARGPIPEECLETYRSQLVLAGYTIADILERYPARPGNRLDGRPVEPTQLIRPWLDAEGRRDGFRHALAVGA